MLCTSSHEALDGDMRRLHNPQFPLAREEGDTFAK